MKKVINILKSNGFQRMDSCVYANDKGICFILGGVSISVINQLGEEIETFNIARFDSDINYLIVGYLFVKGWLKEGYKMPLNYMYS